MTWLVWRQHRQQALPAGRPLAPSWSRPDQASDPVQACQELARQFAYGLFDLAGLVPIGYALFAVALGVLAGALTRRTQTAMTVTLVGFLATRLAEELLARAHFLAPERRTWSSAPMSPNLAELAADGYNLELFHPADLFWLFQGIETALFVALAVLLLLAAIHVIRRRIS